MASEFDEGGHIPPEEPSGAFEKGDVHSIISEALMRVKGRILPGDRASLKSIGENIVVTSDSIRIKLLSTPESAAANPGLQASEDTTELPFWQQHTANKPTGGKSHGEKLDLPDPWLNVSIELGNYGELEIEGDVRNLDLVYEIADETRLKEIAGLVQQHAPETHPLVTITIPKDRQGFSVVYASETPFSLPEQLGLRPDKLPVLVDYIWDDENEQFVQVGVVPDEP